MNEAEEFSRIVGAVLARFFAQNSRTPPTEAERVALGGRLWALGAERGWPRALEEGERGAPGGMSEEECAPLVARVLNGASDELLAGAAKQLVKACFYPEFTVCRDSFREVARDGGCRRQELARARAGERGALCGLPALGRVVAGGARAVSRQGVAEWRGGIRSGARGVFARGFPGSAAVGARGGATGWGVTRRARAMRA